MTGQLFADEIFNPQIKNDLENKGDVQQCKKTAIYFRTHGILNNTVDPENVDRFDNDIQQQKEAQICDEFPFQSRYFTRVRLLRYYLEIA